MSAQRTNIIKYMFILLICVGLQNVACNPKDNFTIVTITNDAPGSTLYCKDWGIIVNGTKYPSYNIPVEFQHDGLTVYAKYELFEDMRMCPCCGGTYADIKSMK